MMLVHIVRPVFMVFTATIGAGRLSPARWRQAVGLLQASFAVFQMVVLPVARQHATLYTTRQSTACRLWRIRTAARDIR